MKRMCLTIALLAALALSGCGQKTETVPPAQEPVNQTATQTTEQTGTAQTAGDRTPTAEELGRAQTMELEFMLEGETTKVPATLYIGQGYSIYIPDEDWRMEKGTEDGFPEETWESMFNDDVELRVLHFSGKTQEEARAFMIAEEDDYRFQEDQQGGLLGTDERDHERMEVRFHPSEDMVYAVLYTYPEEAAEGFDVRLSVMADTFESIT